MFATLLLRIREYPVNDTALGRYAFLKACIICYKLLSGLL
jgi:hypothetical protein